MKEFLLYCKDRRRPLAAFLLCTAAFYGIFALYRLPLSAVLYSFLFCGARTSSLRHLGFPPLFAPSPSPGAAAARNPEYSG